MKKNHTPLVVFILVAVIATGIMWFAAKEGLPVFSPGQATRAIRCIDTDGGQNIFVGGQTSGFDLRSSDPIKKIDSCISIGPDSGKLLEHYCSRNKFVSTTLFGPEKGCNACIYDVLADYTAQVVGVCTDQIPTGTCFETDKGYDIYTKGFVFPQGAAYGKYDVCADKNTLSEYHCEDGQYAGSENVNCPAGCKNGACMQEPTQTCIDSDSDDYYNYGYIKEFVNGEWITTLDTCVNADKAEERVCVNGQGANMYFDCTSGCVNGACLQTPPTEQLSNCRCGTNTFYAGVPCDGVNYELGTKGGYWQCYDGMKQTPDPNTCKLSAEWKADADAFCKWHCSGDCCKDSDGGQNYFVKGTTTGITRCVDQTQCMTQPSTTDTCGGTPSGSPNSLQEYVCDQGIFRSVVFYDCPAGCKDGACTQPIPSSILWTDKKSYSVGEKVVFTIKVAESDGTPFTPEEGAQVVLYMVSPTQKIQDIPMAYDVSRGYYGSVTPPIDQTAEKGVWAAYAVVYKTGTKLTVSEKIYYDVGAAGQADLVGIGAKFSDSSGSLTEPFPADKTFGVVAVIQNKGTTIIDKPFAISFYYDGVLAGTSNVLQTMASGQILYIGGVARPLSAGTHKLKFIVDYVDPVFPSSAGVYSNVIAETDETNNEYTQQIVFQ